MCIGKLIKYPSSKCALRYGLNTDFSVARTCFLSDQ
jgi:hypothetical protein